jgi:hypothetical protein
MKTSILIVIVVLALLTVASGVSPFAARTLAMDVQFNVKDLADHGLRIIAPTDSSFGAELASNDLSDVSDEPFKFLSVFLRNTGGKSAVAYLLRWEMTYLNGRTIHYDQDFSSPMLLMEGRGDVGHIVSPGFVIKPGEVRFFSMVPPSEKDRQSPVGGYGGYADSPSGSIQKADQERHRREAINSLAKAMKDVISVTVSVDGAFFDDGAFVGPNHTRFFEKFKARYDAKRDLYNEVLMMLRSQKTTGEVFEYVESLCRRQPGSESMASEAGADASSHPAYGEGLKRSADPVDKEYDNYKRMCARELVRYSQRVGSWQAIELVRLRLARPWASLRKV